MTKFQTISEIRLARQQLYLKKEMLESQIKEDFDELKESLKPMNMIKDLFHVDGDKNKMNGEALSPTTLNISSTVLDLIISKLLLGKASIVKKILSSYLIHAAGPSVIQKVAPTLVSSLKNLFNTFLKKKSTEPHFEQSTSGDGYGY